MRKILCFFFVCFCAVPLCAEEPPVFIRGIRPLGMGGAFTAVSNDQNAIFYNPAGLMQRDRGLVSIFELPVTIGQDLVDLYTYYDDNEDDLKKFDDLTDARQAEIINDITDNIGKLNPSFGIGFPNIAYISKPSKMVWGLGLFGEAKANFAIRNGILVPNVNVVGSVDILAVAPLAYRIESLAVPYWKGKSFLLSNLSVGANLKYIYRNGISEIRRSVLELEEWKPILQPGTGFGVDLGLFYPYNRLSFGLMVTDFLGTKLSYETKSNKNGETRTGYDTVIPPSVNVGIAWRPSLFNLPLLKDRLTLAADVRDIFDDQSKLLDSTFFTKLHMGAEYRILIFNIRGGLNQGYPTFGLGMDIFALHFDYAYFTDELGKYAGQQPYSKHIVSLALRFGGNPEDKKKQEQEAKNRLAPRADSVLAKLSTQAKSYRSLTR